MVLTTKYPRLITNLQDEFAEVFASEKHGQGFVKIFDAFHNVNLRSQRAFLNPLRHLGGGFVVVRGVVKHHNSLHAGAVYEERQVV